jgi:RING-variant domain
VEAGADDEILVEVETEEERDGNDEDFDPSKDEEPQDNASTLSAEPFESSTATLRCLRTGLVFPSSVAMKLLSMYDDGLSPPVSSAPLPSEAVFCRICREGLHDDADDEQPSPAMENDDGDGERRGASTSPTGSSGQLENDAEDSIDPVDSREPGESAPSIVLSKGPVQPHPSYHPNSHAAENPMLSPCECSGSMAFVHYLCVEQWRCRSRHPEAHQGLNCETCGKPYALPPPSARPASVMQLENEDWLDAMPPHVMAALRQPHIWWQIGAVIVRRRWLRPVAPILMSPIVALYCRARRLLKKKGVARRRWACSLCRRRARWKCVRCLRSYYCSRQCQNVSWHIVHKHVCYKPSRWAWSVIVYGMAALLVFPGVLRDPLMYDLGLGSIPLSFYVMSILGGGIATTLKKSAGLDLRGRTFEMVVLLSTLGMVLLLWGLIGAFFGNPLACYGVLGNHQATEGGGVFFFLKLLQRFFLEPAQNWFLMWDHLCLSSAPWLRKVVCMQDQDNGCFEHLHKANADFLFDSESSGRCSMDMLLIWNLLQAAALVAAGNHLWKRRERHRRAARRPMREVRPHQD